MSKTKLSFKRREQKYLMPQEQFQALWAELFPRLTPDEFCRSTVCSVYYDSEDFELIRRSIDKPPFKEKLRIRSYSVPGEEGEVFVELKKKFMGTVYKRRVQTCERIAEAWLNGHKSAPDDSQTCREIDWFLSFYELRPRIFIASEREAYVAKDNEELRFTFDSSIRWREQELSLSAGSHGQELLEDGQVLMEIKIPEAAPLWLAELLSRLEIFPAGFSKYGRCYASGLLEKYFDGVITIA